jgi:dTDP-4-dehydrorhamnose reductase
MKTIIIGASGIIGYRLFERLKKKEIEVIGTYSKNKRVGLIKFDILKDQIKKKIKINKHDNVIILTAISNPTWVYKNPKISKNINVISTKKIIDDLQGVECKVFFMSSIEVFDGKKGNYDEKSIPKPLNLYGKQKLLIEKYLKKKIKKYCIIRTSFIVGNDPKQRCPVKLTHDSLLEKNARMAKDNFFAITSVKDLCQSIYKILYNKKFKNLNICHLSSKEKISRTKLANYVIKFSALGLKMSYNTTLFKYINYSEPRGRLNNLISSNPIIKKFKFQKAEKVIKEKIKIIENRL